MGTHPSDTDAIRRRPCQESAGIYLPQSQIQSFPDDLRRFEDESMAETWLVSQRWPNGVECPRCHGDNIAQPLHRRPMPYRCRHCRLQFSVRSQSAMQASKLPLSVWVRAFHLCAAVSNPCLVDIDEVLLVAQKSAWTLACRIDEAWALVQRGSYPGETDEAAPTASERPVRYGALRHFPPPISAPPEQLAQAFMLLPPRRTWAFTGHESLRSVRIRTIDGPTGGTLSRPAVADE